MISVVVLCSVYYYDSMPVPSRHLHDLYKLFASIRNEKEARMLLEDILTPQEIQDIAERWQIVRALAAGIPQRTIAENLDVSIATITRGSRMLKAGSGGFHHFLNKSGMKKGWRWLFE